MKRIFGVLFLLSMLVACNQNPATDCGASTPKAEAQESGGTNTTDCTITENPDTSEPAPEPSPAPDEDIPDVGDGTLPTGAYTFGTNIRFLNTNATQQEKFDKAIEIIKKVVATEEFRNQVINYTYNGKKTYVDNGGFTNEEIYQMILEGAETLKPVKNNTMDMDVELYYAATSTVGYTYPNVTKIWVNTKYFNSNAVTSVAANLVHEWLHKLGFKHASSYSVSRDSTVPYAIGRMVGSLGKNFD